MGAIDYLALLQKLDENTQDGNCKNHVNGFIQFVQFPTTTHPTNFLPAEIDKEDFDERAGIMEFDGGMTREEAERLALIDLTRRRTVL